MKKRKKPLNMTAEDRVEMARVSGAIGGKASNPRKRAAVRANLAKANILKAKYWEDVKAGRRIRIIRGKRVCIPASEQATQAAS